MPVKITLALFGHIELDSHASERYRVEGNTFFNTFAYLNQYFKTLSQLSPKLQQLANAMDNLVIKENEIAALCTEDVPSSPSIETGILQRLKSLVSLFQRSPEYRLDALLTKTLKEINRLQAKQFLLLPGGWRGSMSSPGHAMIYQFERDEHGDLLFSIDNAGAGLDFHEKSSSKEKELFSSTKIYKIPQPIDEKELKNLIKRLITPQYKLLLFPKKWDEQSVYEGIHASLRFLNAKHMLQDLSDHRKTTGGQLSGTCSQRSIHQMLKMNFDTLAEYQQFIFDFKMYALKDFLATHPAPSRSAQVNAFIQKAIINNLKILRVPGVFPKQIEQDALVSELIQIQHGLALHENTLMTALLSLNFNHHFLFHFIDSLSKRFLSNRLVAKITAFDNLVCTKVDTAPSFLSTPNDDHLLNDLNAIIQQCQIQSHQNPLWVMMQIEQTILELPIPTACNPEKPYYEDIPRYQYIQSPADFDEIANILDAFNVLYSAASKKILCGASIPTQFITHCSLLALRDYFATKRESRQNKIDSHLYFHARLTQFLSTFRSYPYLACNHPKADERLIDLLKNTNTHIIQPIIKPFVNPSKKGIIPDPLTDYQVILDEYPDLKKRLENLYDLKKYKNNGLHQSLRDENLSALFMLLNEFDENRCLNNDSFLTEKSFEPLIQEIQRRFALEKALYGYLAPLKSLNHDKSVEYTGNRQFGTFKLSIGAKSCGYGISTNPPTCSVSFEYDSIDLKNASNYGPWACKVFFRYYLDTGYPIEPEEKDSLSQHKYNLTASPAKQALIQSYASRFIFNNSNQIQLHPCKENENKGLIDIDEYFARDLFQLRLSPSHQIRLSLDYFNKTEIIHKLLNRDIQLYLEANLFEPGLLLTELSHNPSFFKHFHAFIAKGLQHFKSLDGLLNQESLFFIQLRLNVHRYAALTKLDINFTKHLQHELKELNQLISLQQDPFVLACLHRYRFSCMMTLHQIKAIDDALFPQAFFSLVYLQIHQHALMPDDTTTRFEQQRDRLNFTKWLQQSADTMMTSMATEMMLQFDFDLTHLHVVNEYPRCHFKDAAGNTIYTVHLELGRIFQKNFSLTTVPLSILNHPIIHRLGLNQQLFCWLSEDESIIFYQSQSIRIKKDGSELIIQKKYADKWYELKPLNQAQQHLFGLEKTDVIKNQLPAVLTDASIEAWVSETNTLLVQNHKPIYQIDQLGTISQLHHNGHPNGFVLSNAFRGNALRALHRFEDPSFFLVSINSKHHGKIDFSRYGFHLNISANQITLPDTTYSLMPKEKSPFKPFVAALSFGHEATEMCIIAVQRFYVDQSSLQRVGEYYQFTHDISGYIAKKIISDKPKLIWNHHHTQLAFTYKVVNGEPIPEKASDALYLCYLYLASNEPSKAWGVLNTIGQSMSLSGDIPELMFLYWIVHSLPFKNEHSLHTPEYVACQLKAIALLTDYLILDQAPSFPEDKPYDKRFANQAYEHISHKKIEEFYTDLPTCIHQLYEKYQQGKRHLEHTYTLSDKESRSLLNHCYRNQAIAMGTIGYEQRRLWLKTLFKEYQRLVSLRETTPNFSQDYQKRLIEIEKNISPAHQMMKKSTKIQMVELNLRLPKSFAINTQTVSERSRDIVLRLKYDNVFKDPLDIKTALGALNSAIEEDDFILYFSSYLHIAHSGSIAEKNALQTFCKLYLQAFQHILLDNHLLKEGQSHNIVCLTNILYRVLENPAAFSPDDDLKFDALFQTASRCKISPIMVPQAVDVFEEILSTNQEVWDEFNTSIHAKQPMPILSPMYPNPLWEILSIDDKLQKYMAIESQYQEQLALLQKEADEQTAGQLKYDCIQIQRHIAQTELCHPDILSTLHYRALTINDKHQKDLSRIWKNALRFANKGALEPHLQREQRMHLLTKESCEINQQDLLDLYFHADLSLYVKKTGLSKEACIGLHQITHKAVSLEVLHQQTKRLLNALDEASQSNPPQNRHLHQIANILMSENIPEAQIDPTLMLFQYQENILIRPRQLQALQSLLRPDTNIVEKIIMGGGKSKVILPILAQKKATGLNLLIVEVPRALLATNHVDLNRTSQRLFGQKAHRFEFNRNSDSSAERLKRIYEELMEIMSNQDYLVTTGESMQSLELKYLELLLNKPDDKAFISQWKTQVYWSSQIIALFKKRADVIIDEVHQGLLLKKKLNYTCGEMQAISPKIIQHAIRLYQFIDILAGKTPSIDDLLTHPESPLQLNLNADLQEELRRYFNNLNMPSFIERLDEDEKDKLSFYKEQLMLLPKTRARHYKEHYGPSVQKSTAFKRALAIPYIACNQPNERSHFGSPFALETINYSIQSLLTEGLNEEMLRIAIIQWQATARKELLESCPTYTNIDETPTAKRINQLLCATGLRLQSINFRSIAGPAQLKSLCDHLQHQRSIIYLVLEEHILPQITLERSILHSNSINHVSMFKQVHGLSGTPSNHHTYHRLRFHQQTSLGTDGYIQTSLRQKSTPVIPLAFNHIELFLAQLFQSKPDTRAIIDISATFAGFSNHLIACEIAKLAIHQMPSIQYVLYFNTADVLCALNTLTQQTIVLATSDAAEIDQKLKSRPNERITIYDQSHAIGVDLKQADNAHAFVLADNRTELQNFLQGCMRMRGLEHSQSISIIVPPQTADSLDEFIDLMAKNEHEQLMTDHFFAALAKMDNLVREDFLQRIANLDDDAIDEKHLLSKAFESYLIEEKNKSLFEQYGGIYTEQLTSILLEKHKQTSMHQWSKCLANIDILATTDEVKTMEDSLDMIVQESIPLCKTISLSPTSKDQEGNTEVEHEKEIQKEVEQEKMKENENFDTPLQAVKRHDWKETEHAHVLSAFISHGKTDFMIPINKALADASVFSEQLLTDTNYAKVYSNQSELLCPYVKTVQAILFRKHGDAVTACLIDMSDLCELKGSLSTQSDPMVWITNTQHTLLEGVFPENIFENKDYQMLIEQIRLFNGELNMLIEQKTPFFWLNQAKLAWFHEHMMSYRQTSIHDFRQLQSKMMATPKLTDLGICDMAQIKAEDLPTLKLSVV